ncbi:hypothetical protein AVEN_210608-1 [Araneus ventricosus]|uniref:Uncharacterized protein n=1 Tax=Araneus ventricosus TaxID=182803 RepID=A0A4Y2HWQ7_ARAVE|nr:hypothetical protein AVEN_210608-1 [Araneus ventricosus]
MKQVLGREKDDEKEQTKTTCRVKKSTRMEAGEAVVDYGIGSLSTYHQLQTAEAKVVSQWCVDQGLIASGYQCPKCKQQLGN